MFFAQNAQKFLWNDAAAISIAGFGLKSWDVDEGFCWLMQALRFD